MKIPIRSESKPEPIWMECGDVPVSNLKSLIMQTQSDTLNLKPISTDHLRLYHWTKNNNEEKLIPSSTLVSKINLLEGDVIIVRVDNTPEDSNEKLDNSSGMSISLKDMGSPTKVPPPLPNGPPPRPSARRSRREKRVFKGKDDKDDDDRPLPSVSQQALPKLTKRTSGSIQVLNRVVSVLQVKGPLVERTVNKFETLKAQAGWGMLYFFDINTNKLIEIVPLTNLTFGEVTKKDKITEKYVFVLVDVKKKDRRTFFICETESLLDVWVNAIKTSFDLISPTVFNTSIIDGCLKASSYIPCVVNQCIKYIDKFLDTEGLFRVPGNKKDVQKVKEDFDRGDDLIFVEEDVHVAGGLLKLYFRELRDPLIPLKTYNAINDTWKKKFDSEDSKIDAIKSFLQEMPTCNKTVLAFLLQFLRRVIAHSSKNKMDINNIALVFAPSIFRTASDENQVNVESLGSSTDITKFLLNFADRLFTIEDNERCNSVFFTSDEEITGERYFVTDTEKSAIEAVFREHRGYVDSTMWDTALISLVNTQHQKTGMEPRIVVIDEYRVYIFLRGGKLEVDFHFLDLLKISSPSKAGVTFTYQSGTAKNKVTCSLVPICYASFDIDNIIYHINKIYEYASIGAPPSKKFEQEIAGPERKERLEKIEISDPTIGCGGFVQCYLAICNYFKQEVQQRMIWDLENFYFANGVKVFNVRDMIPKIKFPNPDFQACIQSLSYNTWFTSFKCDTLIRDESAQMIAKALTTNHTIQKLVLKDCGLTRVGIGYLVTAFNENSNTALKEIDFSGNVIDQKCLQSFMDCLKLSLAAKLITLDISNQQIPRNGLKLVFESLGGTVALVNSLTYLNISQNKLDPDSSALMGVFLTLTRALKNFKCSTTAPQYNKLVSAMASGDKAVPCLTVTKLDCSLNPPTTKERTEFVSFLKNFPNLTSLNLTGSTSSADDIIMVIRTMNSLTKLDLSDNDLTDQGIMALTKFMCSTPMPIKKLYLNRVFNRVTPDRPKVMEQLLVTLNSNKIQKLQLRGTRGNLALKDYLIDLIFGLLTNEHLTSLDITGHQAGDDLAIALSKVLAKNNTLRIIYWDLNEITIAGLQAIKLGLQRNSSLRHFELPFMDIFELHRQDTERETLLQLIQDIQRIVSEMADKQTNLKTPAKDQLKSKVVSELTYMQIHKLSLGFKNRPVLPTSSPSVPETIPETPKSENY